jgi:hypothetical protein
MRLRVSLREEWEGNAKNAVAWVGRPCKGGRTLLTIEAKADEPFGTQTVGAYLASASAKPSSNAPERIRTGDL